MANTKKPLISSVASGIIAQKPAGEAHLKVTNTATKLTSQTGIPDSGAGVSDPDKDFKKFMERLVAADYMGNKDDLTQPQLVTWAKENPHLSGDDFDPKDPIDIAYARFQHQNSTDRAVTSDFERETYTPLIVNPRVPAQAGRDRHAPNAVIDDGFKAPTVKLDKSAARLALATDIRTVSEMYAKDAGMSPQDFAKVMGGIATIESRFGVLRSVSGTKYESSAGGAYHYLNGTVAGETRQAMSDPRISSRVATLGVSVADGVSKSEAWILKEDNVLAGSLLARRIVATVRANPELRGNIEALTTRVYQAHNLGDAGASAFARGGRQALEKSDHRADNNNPLFFANAKSDSEIQGRYTKFVSAAIASANPLVDMAFNGTGKPSTVLASNTTPQGYRTLEPS